MIKVVSSTKCWEYGFPSHPESPERVKKTYRYLSEKGYKIIEAIPCSESDILRAHTKKLLTQVRDESFFDADTPAIRNIYNYAALSAGAAIQSAKFASVGENSFSLMRPPGHHAYRDSLGGFCYFNNIAIAVKYLIAHPPMPANNTRRVHQSRSGENSGATLRCSSTKVSATPGLDVKVETLINPRIAILDIDCHHGNGTEDIFYCEENILFISIHQSPLYPGTGLKSNQNCLNYPIPPGTDEDGYCKVLECSLKEIKKFKPSIIAVSAGFDTYKNDPLTNLNLTKESYKKIGEIIRSVNLPLFAVLEGGYSPDLPECIYNFLSVL